MLVKNKLKREAYKKIEEFLKQVKHLKPKTIILFGSYAKNEFTEFSDIDICLIAENLPENIFERRSLSGLYKVPSLRVIGYYPKEFLEEIKKPNFFIYDILNDGKIIYDDGFIKEAKKLWKKVIKELAIVKNKDKWIFTKSS
ncbi:MAG: nucleotidyltransferase domain-containing protein [Nitrososphaerota archaeon]